MRIKEDSLTNQTEPGHNVQASPDGWETVETD